MKIKGTEISLSTANTVDSARLVKVTIVTGNSVITMGNGGTTTLGIGTYFVEKDATETIAAAPAVLATSVAFTNN